MGRVPATFVLLVLATNAFAAGPVQVRLHVDASDRVNAVYHLACLAGSIACTKDNFERFWKGDLGWTAADQVALEAWRAVMKDVTEHAPPRQPATLLPNTRRFHPGQAAREKVLAAAVESDSSRRLVERSGGILTMVTADRIESAIDHVERRIRSWWRSSNGRKTYLNEAVATAAPGLTATTTPEPSDQSYNHPYIQPLSSATGPAERRHRHR
jgi:hypothetical protein